MNTRSKQLLLGDEAVAAGAIDAGISGAYAYPGTPSTEILECVQKIVKSENLSLHCQWSANEKTAMEAALGVAYSGKRAMVSMKHVGINVAADCFMSAAITGVLGGMIIVLCDDPGMHSSQNEQDSRFYAKFAGVPLFAPANQQQAYDMVFEALDLSEKLEVPVIIRLTTRLAHSRGIVTPVNQRREENPLRLPPDRRQFVLIPLNAKVNYRKLLDKQPAIRQAAATSPNNVITKSDNNALGIIAAGLAADLVSEVAADGEYKILKITQYPIPEAMIKEMADSCDELLVIEEGQPVIEEMMHGLLGAPLPIHGRLDGTLPRVGELSPEDIASALGKAAPETLEVPDIVVGRPPKLCQGCAHSGSFGYMKEMLKGIENVRVFSDIGCYALGALPPYEAIDTCVDMGASITMAKGASDAGLHPAIAVIGDSTFTHSGMTGLLDCVVEKTKITVIILDNDTTAMTGGQYSHASEGRLEKICRGLGVEDDHLHILNPIPQQKAKNVEILRNEVEYDGVSVIISRQPCIQILKRRTRKQKNDN